MFCLSSSPFPFQYLTFFLIADGLPPPKTADIVFLVDGSINLGKTNFNKMTAFISKLLGLFFTERDDLRIGLAHYATDVTDVFYLNTYKNRKDIADAISRVEYKGGNKINTGAAIRHVQDVHFTKEKGSRADEGIPQILMVLTGGNSADDTKSAILGLNKKRVRVFAVGVGDTEKELQNLASEPTTMARASTVDGLSEYVEQILETLDDEVKGKLCVDTRETPKSKTHSVLFLFLLMGLRTNKHIEFNFWYLDVVCEKKKKKILKCSPTLSYSLQC